MGIKSNTVVTIETRKVTLIRRISPAGTSAPRLAKAGRFEPENTNLKTGASDACSEAGFTMIEPLDTNRPE